MSETKEAAVTSLFAHIAARVHSQWCGWGIHSGMARYIVATDKRLDDGRRYWSVVGFVSVEYAELIIKLDQRQRAKRVDRIVAALKSKIKELPCQK